jgi:hypothetical protein
MKKVILAVVVIELSIVRISAQGKIPRDTISGKKSHKTGRDFQYLQQSQDSTRTIIGKKTIKNICINPRPNDTSDFDFIRRMIKAPSPRPINDVINVPEK